MLSALTPTVTATQLGQSVPHLPHAISVSLPTWRDNVDYEEGAKRVVDSMRTGYPRFFIHRSIQLLCRVCEQKFGLLNERSLLFPSAAFANACREYMNNHKSIPGSIRLVQYTICPQSTLERSSAAASAPDTLIVNAPCQAATDLVELHVVLFPPELFPLAKSFWQHTGNGISSRMAEKCLAFLGVPLSVVESLVSPITDAPSTTGNVSSVSSRYGRSVKGAAKHAPRGRSIVSTQRNADANTADGETDNLAGDQTAYLEERYGRSLPLTYYSVAKKALKRRIAGVLLRDANSPSDPVEAIGGSNANVGESWRGVRSVTEDDVFLFPTGMSAIWHAHQLALNAAPEMGKVAGKSICFGFPYTDTLKILQKWGPGCHFLGHGLDRDIPEVARLAKESAAASEPILSLFAEFPSNPLLRSPDLNKLRKIADEHDFIIIVDETIGNFVNVDVMKYADVVVSSLTKVFSGETNVMGGSLVLNPQGRRYQLLYDYLTQNYEDSYWPEDSVFMERNSRDFQRRIDVINRNAEAVADFLREQSEVHSGGSGRIIKEVFYPKWVTRENYDKCRNPWTESSEHRPSYPSGFGGLLSITFTTTLAAQVFFDNLGCEKGPSLGTNFTLACPYTILAHYNELDWALSWGVDPSLVRVSVGMEDRELLLNWFKTAIREAEAAVAGKA